MTDYSLSTKIRDQFMAVSTATICTALFKRGLRNQFIQNVHPLNAKLGNMVGQAFTLRYIPAREDLNTLSVLRTVRIRSAKRWRNARRALCL